MLQEQKELYNYTKNNFMQDLKRISPTCILIEDYCSTGTKATDIFSNENFHAVSEKICNEIIDGEL